jgi:hypothetical protein
MRDELRAYQGMRDRGEVSMSDREITDSANRIADDVMRSKGLPSGEELQEWRIQREAEDDISSRSDKPYWFLNPAAIDRAATRVIAGTASTQAKVADFATAPIQAALGRSDKDYFSGTASDARNLLDLQSRAASEESSGIGEDLLTGLVQFAGDPAFVGAYTKTRAALRAANAARGQNAVRATRLNASDDIIAGGAGDLLASGIRSDFDPEQMKEEFGLGLIGGVAMEGVSRGIGAAWKKAFPGKPLPRSKSEAEQALDAYDPEWRNKPLDPDSPMGQLQAATKDLQDEVDNVRIIEAEKQAAKYDPGERIETPEQGAKKGIDRFNDRQAARDEKLQEGLDAPHIAKDKAKRGVVDRLEAENQGGKVLDFEAEQARIQEDVRAEALKDPDTFELVNELQTGGMSRAQAEAIAIPELDTPAPRVEDVPNVGADAPDLGAPKAEWQMTQAERVELGAKSRTEKYAKEPWRVVDKESGEVVGEIPGNRVDDLKDKYTAEPISGVSDPVADNGWVGNVKQRHKQEVEAALAEGKPVPPEVLKDYPDLTPTRPVEGASGEQQAIDFGNPRHTETPEFKRFFGDWQGDPANASKVVDAAGEPLVVYHGTTASFDTFDMSKAARGSGADVGGSNYYGNGFYFAPRSGDTNFYLRSGSLPSDVKGGASVVPAYIDIKNPVVVKGGPSEIDNILEGWGYNTDDLIDFGAAARERGHDGVFVYHAKSAAAWEKPDEFVAFSPNQVKSVNNRGTWNPNDPSMLRSGIAPDDIAAMVSDAIAAGKWTAKQAIIGARWALEVGGDAIKTMRDFAGVMLDKFGRGIRKHIPEMWQKFKAMRQRVAATRERTRLARQKGGIDLRRQPVSPEGRNFQRESVAEGASRSWSDLGRMFDYATFPVADKLRKINPRLVNRLYRFDTEARIAKHELRGIMDPLMQSKEVKRLSKSNRNVLKSALLNGDDASLSKLADSLPGPQGAKIKEMHSEARRILDDLFDEMESVGMTPMYRRGFWPRRIKKGRVRELRKKLSNEERDQFNDAIREVANRKYAGNKNLVSDEEVASIIDRVMAGYGPRPIDSSNPSIIKQRRVDEIPDEMLHYYEDFDVSLDAYIEKASKEIAKRRMLGGNKSLDLDNAENLSNSIGKIINEYNIQGQEADDVVDIIQSIFHGGETPAGKLTRGARAITYALTMGQLQSALRQIEDMSTIAGQAVVTDHYSIADVLKASYRVGTRSSDIKMLDLGLDRIAEEYTTAGSQKMVDLVFKLTGLRWTDRQIKNIAIDSALLGGQRKARKAPEAFKKSLSSEFGDEAAGRLVKSLAAGEIDDEVLVYLSTRLGDIQPVTGLEVPQGYLRAREAFSDNSWLAGSPVLAYQLRTFAARRFGLIRREALDHIAAGISDVIAKDRNTAEGVKRSLKGFKNLMALLSIYIASGAAVDQGIDRVLNDKDTSIDESLADATLQILGQSRYSVQQVQRSGESGYTAALAPPAGPTLWQLLTDIDRISKGKDARSVYPHKKTVDMIKRYMGSGSGEGNSPAPPKPPSPPSPPRP